MRLRCWYCHKAVSTELPDDMLFRAIAVCPECIAESSEAKEYLLGEAKKGGACMKKIIIEKEEKDTIKLSDVKGDVVPIFAKRDGVLKGMVVHDENIGWVLRIGGTLGSSGYYSTLRECIEKGMQYEYEFFVN